MLILNRMKKKVIYICFILIAFILHSCELDELDKPTTVSLTISTLGKGYINQEDDDDDDDDDEKEGKDKIQSRQAGLFIEGGEVYIAEIELDGTRENAEDYYFSKVFEQMLHADLYSDNLDRNVEFKIPQGSYAKVDLNIYLSNPDNSSTINLKGKYRLGAAKDMDVEIKFDMEDIEEKTLKLTLFNTNNEKQILFKKNQARSIDIQINLKKLLNPLNPGRLNQAQSIQTSEGKKIIISAQHNNQLYRQLKSRIENSFRAVIK
jgi:hypothetical protein